MKTVVLFYSRTGKTKAEAERKAKDENADIFEVKEIKKRNPFTLFTGCYRALTRKASEIKPITPDLQAYEKIILMGPIWAGHPAPPVNGMIKALPEGKRVEFVMTSSGGNSSKSAEGTKKLAESHGCEVIGYTDVKS